MLITDKINKRLLFSCLLIFAVIVVILGFVVNPSFVSRHLSSEGILEKPTIIKTYIMESFIVTFGFILFLYSLIKVIKSDYARIIDEKTIRYAKKIDKKITTILIHFKFFKKDDAPLLQRVILIWIIFLLITMASGLLDVSGSWQKALGWEYLRIAQGIESGHGFSSKSYRRCEEEDNSNSCGEYYLPTARKEPVYPILMAYMLKAFGKYGRLAILIFQVVALFLTSIVIYHLSRKVFNAATGILAGLALPLLPGIKLLAQSVFVPAIFAGLMIGISLYLLLWCLEKMSVRRGIALGFMLGFTCLTRASTLLFIPIAVLFVLISKRPFRSVAIKTALAVLFAAITLMSVWTTRNLLVFGQFVPVRTGFGRTFYQNNPILAATFSSGSHACSDNFGPLWKVQNAREAIKVARTSREKARAVFRRGFYCIKQEAPKGYERYNEAEKDSLYLKKALEFIFSEPRTFAILTYNRFLAFFFWDWKLGIISLLFGVSALMTLSNQKTRTLILLVFAYTIPYSISLPTFYRYRYPIEPILIIFASYLLALIISKIYAFLRH